MSHKVIRGHVVRKITYDFLLVFHSNTNMTLFGYIFEKMESNWPEIAIFVYLRLNYLCQFFLLNSEI